MRPWRVRSPGPPSLSHKGPQVLGSAGAPFHRRGAADGAAVGVLWATPINAASLLRQIAQPEPAIVDGEAGLGALRLRCREHSGHEVEAVKEATVAKRRKGGRKSPASLPPVEPSCPIDVDCRCQCQTVRSRPASSRRLRFWLSPGRRCRLLLSCLGPVLVHEGGSFDCHGMRGPRAMEAIDGEDAIEPCT